LKRIHVLAIAVVILHALIVIPHGMAHSNLHIQMNRWQNVYILVVINLLPLLAAVLIWRRKRTGFLILLFSMAGSFLFGAFYHFIAAGPDNVASLTAHPWTQTFQWTAVLLALSEAIGFFVGIRGSYSR
jgi:cytochrome bd-type quinol oxidase subunit 2